MKDLNTYIDQKQKQLDQWTRDLETLEKKALTATADARKEMQARIGEFQASLKRGEAKLDSLRKATTETRSSVKESVETAWTELQKTAVHAKERLTEAMTA